MTALRRRLLSFVSAKRGMSSIEYGLLTALIVGVVMLGQAVMSNGNCSGVSLGSSELKLSDQNFQSFIDHARDIPSQLFCR